jgi:antirestriction protein ArdC
MVGMTKLDSQVTGFKSIKKVERCIASMPELPHIIQADIINPKYSLFDDAIYMPALEHFPSAMAYYSALFHELAHATGNRKRLDRWCSFIRKNTPEYAFEEMVAELSSIFCLYRLQIADGKIQEESIEYISGWCAMLPETESSGALEKAITIAERIRDYIFNQL